jgi:hypothetical protein
MERKDVRALNRALLKTLRQEEEFLLKEERPQKWKKTIKNRVPENLQRSLELVFRKTFEGVFLHGSGLVGKTLPEERLKRGHHEADCLTGKQPCRGLRRMARPASRCSLGSTALATGEGLGMGLVGLGLPDIPLFVTVLLRGVRGIGMSYGFSWEEPGEDVFVLRLLQAALAAPEERDAAFRALGEKPSGDLPGELERTASALSRALLLEKFIQGVPLVGAAGGLVNNAVCRRVFRLASIQYRKRYLQKKLAGLEAKMG